MKNTIFLFIAALFFGVSVQAQSTSDSIAAKYQLQPMPQPLTIEKTFPVLGTYQLNSAAGTAQNVVITLDSSNKGIVWIEGLPEGRLKAYMRKAPATYRIISQKSANGRQVPEGTLIFDPNSNTLNIALGKAFNNDDPASIFNLNQSVADAAGGQPSVVKVKTKSASKKEKSKLMFYTAIKTEQASSTSTNAAKE